MRRYRIAVIRGDGVGKEFTPPGLRSPYRDLEDEWLIIGRSKGLMARRSAPIPLCTRKRSRSFHLAAPPGDELRAALIARINP